MSWAKRASFTSPSQPDAFYLFLLPDCSGQGSQPHVEQEGSKCHECGRPGLVSGLRQKGSSFPPSGMILADGLSSVAFAMLSYP